MKKNLMILLILVNCITTFSQSFNEDEAMKHYWYYRNRLKYFVVPGEDYGQSQITCIRNTFFPHYCDLSTEEPECNLDFGQHTIYFGYYLGVLATEYHLLGLANRTEDQENTYLETYYAIRNWQHYLDSCEVNYPGGYLLSSIVNGFFIRSDARNIFDASDNLNYLNDGLTMQHNHWGADNSPFTFGQVPEGHPGYSYLVNSEDCVEYYEAMSQDEAYGLLLGLALIKKFMPETTVCEMATIEAYNVIDYMANSQFFGAWFFTDPNGDQVAGGDAWELAWGCAMAAQYFGYPWQLFMNPGTKDLQYSIWQVFQGNPVGPGGESNASMFVTLAAIGDSWELPFPFPFPHFENTTWEGIDKVITQDWESFYVLLYKSLHFNAPIPANVLEAYRNDAKNKLADAPDEGPYYYADNHHAGGGWAATYRWHKQITDQVGGNYEWSGNYNGLDYMLLENLHLIIEDNFGPGINLQAYHPYIHGKLCEIFPVKINDTRILGTDAEPIHRKYFKTITSTSNIQANTNYYINNGMLSPLPIPIVGESGNVTYLGGDEIILTYGENGEGFTVEKGANFVATIKHPLIFYHNEFDLNSFQLDLNPCTQNNSLKEYPFHNLNKFAQDSVVQTLSNCFIVYPNPVTNSLRIKSRNNSIDKMRVVIINYLGNVLYDKEVFKDNLEIDFSEKVSGIYFVNIFSKENCSTFKVVKL